MNRIILSTATALALLLAPPVLAQDEDAPQPTPNAPSASEQNDAPPDVVEADTPQAFASMAAVSNLFEIQSSQIALEKSQTQAVRDFAQRMIDDHTMATEEMVQAAEADGVTDIPQTLDARHQQMIARLQDAPAEGFDNDYLQMQITAHEEAISLFESFATAEGALADFAEATLPTLQEHLNMAREIAI